MSEKQVITVGWLKKYLEHSRSDDLEVKVVLSLPSIGPKATTNVQSAVYGFDWDKGLLLRTEEQLVPKSEKQSIYESANDLLMMLATEWYIRKKDNYETRTAKKILLKYGYTEEKLRKYVHLFHGDAEVVR